MKKISYLFMAVLCCFCCTAICDLSYAAEKTRAQLQTDLATYKIRQYNAEVNYDRLIDITDSMLAKSTDFVTTYSSGQNSNPVVLGSRVSLTAAQVNAGVNFLEVATSNYLTLHNITLNASGTAADATAVVVECSGGTDISSFPIAMLTDDVPVNPFASVGGANATNSEELVNGCPQDESLAIVKTGSNLTGTSHLIVNYTYSIQ